MVKDLAPGSRYRIERDGTGEVFDAVLVGFGSNGSGAAVGIFRLDPVEELIIDARTGRRSSVRYVAANDRYADSTGFPDFPVPVNLLRLHELAASGEVVGMDRGVTFGLASIVRSDHD